MIRVTPLRSPVGPPKDCALIEARTLARLDNSPIDNQVLAFYDREVLAGFIVVPADLNSKIVKAISPLFTVKGVKPRPTRRFKARY
jgi:hypothetical protein